jgi:hypothetical protein
MDRQDEARTAAYPELPICSEAGEMVLRDASTPSRLYFRHSRGQVRRERFGLRAKARVSSDPASDSAVARATPAHNKFITIAGQRVAAFYVDCDIERCQLRSGR